MISAKPLVVTVEAVVGILSAVVLSLTTSFLNRIEEAAEQVLPVRKVTSLRLERHKLLPGVLVAVKPSKPTVPVTERVRQGVVEPKPVLTVKFILSPAVPKVKVFVPCP